MHFDGPPKAILISHARAPQPVDKTAPIFAWTGHANTIPFRSLQPVAIHSLSQPLEQSTLQLA